MPSSGVLEWNGHQYGGIRSPAEAAAVGVRIVHQESPLIDSLTVLESIATFRGYGTSGVKPIRWRTLRKQTTMLLEQMTCQ